MLGIVLTGHGGFASGTLKALAHLSGRKPEQCVVVEYDEGLSTNMLSRMMCDALHNADSGEGVVFIADVLGAPPFRTAALMCHKHPQCEVVSGVSLEALAKLLPLRATLSAATFRDTALAYTQDSVSSLWHEQQKQPGIDWGNETA
ncbi:PTS sugar transporter subunit IIA [Enterobacillus tribolii]|uniref:PTS system ascorbate-specific IIA component n=1 Tax=Enterobacillus tribolii TaxID=1487935 RepID=A0A370QPY0_9GAMM|nr:PTS sugar transporter subunit IIA [Enterobacillus tribolii]MBW7981464.1 PTS sugar transporter subunit IIA [Enterobacillus tribolii]RDK90841.1 PTS system ascorbate-specific IIA component [Enterobacillus tribolii]